ncbi:GFA family protein [Litoreibacter roseus]|uniref:GFA family protein n=1 Tax=Litoreibacter roseus TaxID=2601869 RepID=UPI00135AACB6|nr:GFA family protein [Litoreibacter roseus]
MSGSGAGTRQTASCHCGAVEITFTMKDDWSDARRCDCSLCRRVKPAALSSDVDALEVIRGQDTLKLYQFGTKTARHYFCGICGTHTHHQRRSNPSEMGVNVGCIVGADPRSAGDALWVDGVRHPNDPK